MGNLSSEVLFFMARVVERLCAIEGVAGTCGNLSVTADDLAAGDLPAEGRRDPEVLPLGAAVPGLEGRRFLISGSGKNLRYIAHRPHDCLALVELLGEEYRVLWGLRPGEPVTSESSAHLETYRRRPSVTAFIHAQPTSVNVLTRLFHSEESLNRLLFAQHEQLRVCAAAGIGLVPYLEHGSLELAEAVASSLERRDICAVARHGTFSVGHGDPVSGLNSACDVQEYYHDASRTFLDNPWLRLLPMESILKGLGRVSRLPLGEKLVNAFLRPPGA